MSPSTKIILLAVLFILLSSAASAPSATTDHLDAGFTNRTSDALSILSSRDETWSPNQPRIVGLGNNMEFETCKPNSANTYMCYVSYVEKNSWYGTGVIWAYDHSCNQLGYINPVSRTWLDKTWTFPTDQNLPVKVSKLKLHVKKSWDDSNNDGFEIVFGKQHTKPFKSKSYGGFTLKTHFDSMEDGKKVVWTAARAAFYCAQSSD